MKTWIYSWVVYPVLYSLASLLGMAKPKIRETLRLRSWKDFLSLRFNVGQPIEYWIHVASYGELEYAIPILQELARRHKRVLVTYYSISAKTPVEALPQNFPNVSLVVPLPHDGLGLMKEFVSLVRRQGVHRLLLMKYELWPGLLWECNAQGIKVVLVDALRPSWFHRRLLHKLDGILSGYDFEVASVSHPYVKVVGDTRVERVIQRVEQSERRLGEVISAPLKRVLGERPTLVCGSMWPEDDRVLLGALRELKKDSAPGFNIVWVPHEMDQAEEARMRAALGELGYRVAAIDAPESELQAAAGAPVAIMVMKKGILVELYRLGQAAIVGGGFGAGVHSVWEPALAGAAVACGPKTERSPESTELGRFGALTRITDEASLRGWLAGNLNARPAPKPLTEILKQHQGASRRIIEVCELM